MLLNLSNHPLSKWTQEQRAAALHQFGAIEDVPFPQLDPAASLNDIQKIVSEFVTTCVQRLEHEPPPNAIHLMGEFTFTYQFVKEMEQRGILCVASTTERIVTEDPEDPTKKTTTFRFVQFRPYFVLPAVKTQR
jgi:hypothetical protein